LHENHDEDLRDPRAWLSSKRRLHPMARPELSRRVGRVIAYRLLCDMNDLQRREFHRRCSTPTASRICPGSGRRRS
jgi:hypothetical protein